MSQKKIDIATAVEMAYKLYQQKQYHQCVDICIQILAIDYTRADIWNLAGIVMLELKIYKRAIEYFTQAAKCNQRDLDYQINLAEAYRRSGNPTQCVEKLEWLLNAGNVSNPNLHFNLAKAYADLEDSEKSIYHYTIAIKLDPNDLGAMFNLANAQVSLKHFGEAIELYLHALGKGYLDAGVNLANTYIHIGLFNEAVQVYSAIYEYYKDEGDFLFNYANALNYANTNAQHALMLYLQASALNPANVHYRTNYAHFLLKNLHFEEGFRIYEERKKLPNMLPEGITSFWEYNGEKADFADKSVLVYHEQGFGDSIMFARFLPLLIQCTKKVRVIVQETLVPLFSKFGIECVAHRDEVGDYDVAISLLSLPLALGVRSVEDLHITPFLLQNTQSRTTELNKGLQHTIKIGICFSTDSQFSEASSKSMPLKLLMEALSDESIAQHLEIYSLNKAQCKEISEYAIVQKTMNDFAETYDIIKDMDMVISIDSAVAHLSASMGKHTLVLLHKGYDWRWGNGISTPWYESAVCITQSKMGEWGDVAHNVSAYVKGFLG
ncbi:tetratricopeptide repeat protein [Helicobacter typhlonius]|uniref:Tetratricopeptide repeat protein n=3 Tax=Helicobacter typhlonius TaxID=76936 RepID=A0A099UIC7_9HELI|nr:tetratricopeptide repeat protein [Helicobacter typhlonius]TLD78481.1 tetratricopeptide repeat protein [Helicobacter typhlonius]CUU39730.1 Hypothetical protein-TPR-repeat-containing [Helicobacter typhlonius]